MTSPAQTDGLGDREVDTDLHGIGPGQLVNRPLAALRPLKRYIDLLRFAVPRLGHELVGSTAVLQPLLVTEDGTIFDGHTRWRTALAQGLSSLPCVVYDITDEQALELVLQRQRSSSPLNSYCRVVMALSLEGHFRRRNRESTDMLAGPSLSKLTNNARTDVRADIARAAGVSTGNVTKVKQILESAIPKVREGLLRGEITIHRAWGWRTLSPKEQRDALWTHLQRGGIKRTIAKLIKGHVDARAPVGPTDAVATLLGGIGGLDADDITVAVVDVPGRAVVLTRACYEELQEQNTT